MGIAAVYKRVVCIIVILASCHVQRVWPPLDLERLRHTLATQGSYPQAHSSWNEQISVTDCMRPSRVSLTHTMCRKKRNKCNLVYSWYVSNNKWEPWVHRKLLFSSILSVRLTNIFDSLCVIRTLLIEPWYSVVNSRISGVQPIMLFFKCFTPVSIISCASEALRTQHAIMYIHICIAHNYKASLSSLEGKCKEKKSITCFTNTLASVFCQNTIQRIVYRTVLLFSSYYLFIKQSSKIR